MANLARIVINLLLNFGDSVDSMLEVLVKISQQCCVRSWILVWGSDIHIPHTSVDKNVSSFVS